MIFLLSFKFLKPMKIDDPSIKLKSFIFLLLCLPCNEIIKRSVNRSYGFKCEVSTKKEIKLICVRTPREIKGNKVPVLVFFNLCVEENAVGPREVFDHDKVDP